MNLRVVFLVLPLIVILEAQKIVKFGAFFGDDEIEASSVFRTAITRHNAFNEEFRFEPIIKSITSLDSFQVERAVCEMIESGVVAIFGPNLVYMSDIVTSICNELKIPHLVSYHRTPEINKNPYHKFTRNIFPDAALLSKALVDVVRSNDWRKFAVIYDSDEGLIRLDGILQLYPAGRRAVTVYKFPGKQDIKTMLKKISKSLEYRIIVDCSIENIAEIIKHGLDVNMMTEYMTYLITSPDGHMLIIPDSKNFRSNITTIRIMRNEDVETINIVNEWRKDKMFLNAEQSRIAQEMTAPNRLKLQSALVRDAVTVISNALKKGELYRWIGGPTTTCNNLGDENQFWRAGVEQLKNIDNSSAEVQSGEIRFDEDYKTREDFWMDIVEYERSQKSFIKVAHWSAKNGLNITRSTSELASQKAATIRTKEFIVVTRLAEPYLEVIPNGTDLVGNNRYEGFVKDIMDAIANKKGFTYKLFVVPDNHPGSLDHATGKWTGMIGEILEGRADLAISDFTITYERKTVIDFSSPLMTLGISILYAKQQKPPPELLKFLTPLDTTVWLYMSTGVLCVSITLYVLAKITEADWENPHPCEEEPEELENIWNIHNCLWLSVGSIMQSGCDILPKGIPTRLAAASWWFFAMIVISSYTANLAAFLTKEQMDESFQNAEDLSKESKVKYGLMRNGSTELFFRESTKQVYQKMWATMEHADPSVFVDSNEEGIQRVKQSNRGYAFLMESSTIDYITQKECNIIRVGSPLDSKAYGIGMPMNSPFRADIDEAILQLKEDRVIQHIKEKWWITNNVPIIDGVPTNCTKEKEQSDELTIAHVLGVFMVLATGVGLATLIGILEFLWNVRKVSISQKITPYEALQSELMFACKVWNKRRPVLEARESQSPSSSDSSEKS